MRAQPNEFSAPKIIATNVTFQLRILASILTTTMIFIFKFQKLTEAKSNSVFAYANKVVFFSFIHLWLERVYLKFRCEYKSYRGYLSESQTKGWRLFALVYYIPAKFSIHGYFGLCARGEKICEKVA